MALNELDDLYLDIILDHSRSPRNQERLQKADIVVEGVNPFCGDETLIQIALDSGRVSRVGGGSKGCAISQASRSMLTELLEGKTLEEIEHLVSVFEDMMSGGQPPEEELEKLGDVRLLESVRKFPVRIKCALLAWTALEDGIEDYHSRQEA